MNLCEAHGKMLFEVRPDLFPEGILTKTEEELWALYYKERQENRPK